MKINEVLILFNIIPVLRTATPALELSPFIISKQTAAAHLIPTP